MRIDLHIGLEKTGSTSIQGFLRGNREALLAAGVLYPESPGGLNHIKLAAYAVDDPKSDRLLKRHSGGDEAPTDPFRTDFATALIEECRASRAERVLLSNEHLSSRLHTAAELRRLKDLLNRVGEVRRILVYLRRQDDLLLSGYSTSIKSGGRKRFEVPPVGAAKPWYDFEALLSLWAGVFGRDVMTVRLFEPEAFEGGDLLKDVCAALDLPAHHLAFPERSRNESLSAEALEFVRLLNRGGLAAAELVPPRVTSLLARVEGPRLSLSTPDRRAFVDRYSGGNARVARDWLGRTDGRLFADVPESCGHTPLPELTAARVAELSINLFLDQEARLLKQRERKARRRETSFQMPKTERRRLKMRQPGSKPSGEGSDA